MAALRQVVRSGFCSTKYRAVNAHSNSGTSRLNYRQISQLVAPNGNHVFPVDTSALLRSLEAQGVPSKQAEAISSAVKEVLNDSLENVAAKMQKTEMMQESNLSKFKSEVKSSQEHRFSLLQLETEKLRGDIENMRSELRYEIDKVTAGHRLELDLERGRNRDVIANQNAEINILTQKLDQVALKAQQYASDYGTGALFFIMVVDLIVR